MGKNWQITREDCRAEVPASRYVNFSKVFVAQLCVLMTRECLLSVKDVSHSKGDENVTNK